MSRSKSTGVDGVLRLFMLSLVLLDLLFVQITGAASIAWLMPLYVLTLISPILTRFTELKVYRLAWTLGLIGIFVMLLMDAMDTGIAHLLEDGLLLAAYCQVHLLNNLNRRQKPDLLFFTSFLIPLVTSFFSQDLSYSLIFLLYAPVLVVTMQLASISCSGCELRIGGRGSRLMASVGRSGLKHAFVTMIVTAAVFLYLPRDFNRPGLVQAFLEKQSGQSLTEVDFSDEIKLGSVEHVLASNRIVMKVSLEKGNRASVPTHWRGATFNDYAYEEWSAVRYSGHRPTGAMDERWTLKGGTRHFYRSKLHRPHTESLRLRVEIVASRITKLFHPLQGQSLSVHHPIVPEAVHPLVDGTLLYSPGSRRFPANEPFAYSIEVPWLASRRGGRFAPKQTWQHARFLHLSSRTRRKSVAKLASKILGKRSASYEQHEIVSALKRYLVENFSYLPPGAKGGANSIDEFLEGNNGAHCEYFATALTILLRSEDIPCRLVSGYYSNEWDYAGKELLFRKKHAHAWVEVNDPRAGWYVVDPSPTGDGSAADDESGLWRRIMGSIQGFWRELTSFDDSGRARALAWLLALPGNCVAAALRSPVISIAVIALLALGVWRVRTSRRNRSPPAVREYLDCLRASGLETLSGETPRELLERARGLDLAAPMLAKLSERTHVHERERYALRPRA